MRDEKPIVFGGVGRESFRIDKHQNCKNTEETRHEQRFNVFPQIKGNKTAESLNCCSLLTDPYILLDDDMVDVRGIDLFDAGLDQGVVVHLDGKRKGFAFPVAVRVIVEVFRILVARQRIIAPSAVEMIGRVLWRVFVVPQKSKMGVVDDLDHPEIAGIKNGVFSGDRHSRYELPGAVQADPDGVGMGAGVNGKAGSEKDKSENGIEFHMFNCWAPPSQGGN